MKEQTEQTKMIKINPNISEFTVNVSGLNSPVKKKKRNCQIVSFFLIQQYAIHRRHICTRKEKDEKVRDKSIGKVYQANTNQRKLMLVICHLNQL